MSENISFPQYRKYKNEKSFFKISSLTEWEEIQIVGSKKLLYHFTVKILPDRNFINDMLWGYEENWVKIEEMEHITHTPSTSREGNQ